MTATPPRPQPDTLTDDHTAPYNLYQPPHFIASDVLRRIEDLLEDNGVKVTLGGRIHEAVELLVKQYQDKLMSDADATRPPTADGGR